jgi:D-arabinose 1-dehydrogenase-like Zn-dependent alcohol dehydrogenase
MTELSNKNMAVIGGNGGPGHVIVETANAEGARALAVARRQESLTRDHPCRAESSQRHAIARNQATWTMRTRGMTNLVRIYGTLSILLFISLVSGLTMINRALTDLIYRRRPNVSMCWNSNSSK